MPLVAGRITCETGRAELVAVTPEQRDDLSNGELPCPACAAFCRPTFELLANTESMTVSTWRSADGLTKSWHPGHVLRK